MFYCKCFIYFFIQHEISEMCQSIGVKFCMVISSRPSFIMTAQNFEGPPPKNAKFGPISDDFKVWR